MNFQIFDNFDFFVIYPNMIITIESQDKLSYDYHNFKNSTLVSIYSSSTKLYLIFLSYFSRLLYNKRLKIFIIIEVGFTIFDIINLFAQKLNFNSKILFN